LLHLELLGTRSAGLLGDGGWHGGLRGSLLRLDLLLRLLWGGHLGWEGIGHVVQEVGKLGRAQEHAGQVVETGILLVEGTVLETQLVSLVGAGRNLALKLTNVLCRKMVIS
jgi:hypothetical protein